MARPTLVFVFGPPAVGKLRVGTELAAETGYALLHNHRTIDLLTDFFAFESAPFTRLNESFRLQLLEELARQGRGVIMTAAWRFDMPGDRIAVDSYCEPFRQRRGDVHFVELRAGLEARLERNRSRWRADRKKVDWADEEYLRESSRLHRFETDGDFPYPDEHLVLDTTELQPREATASIVAFFGLAPERDQPATGEPAWRSTTAAEVS